MFACEKNYPETVELLLNKGANKELKDENGYTALMFACQNGHEKLVTKLIDAGADKLTKNNNQCDALDIVCRNEYNNCLPMLIDTLTPEEALMVRTMVTEGDMSPAQAINYVRSVSTMSSIFNELIPEFSESGEEDESDSDAGEESDSDAGEESNNDNE